MRTATQLRLVGWVRNADDELAVDIVAEGPPAALDAFESQLGRGPSAALVDGVDVSRGPASGGMSHFEVRQ